MLAPRRNHLNLLIGLSLLAVVLFYYRHSARDLYTQLPSSSRPVSIARNSPSNTTLGFGAVVVVSRAGSERQLGLLQAANVTGIDLTIPSQPSWSEDDVNKFRQGRDDPDITTGSVYAWLGHNNALRWFLDSGLETALILEDDVDWDIQLRSLQVPLAANAARSMLSSSKYLSRFEVDAAQYWGDTSAWDLLYLGHCGDYFHPLEKGIGRGYQFKENLTSIPHKLYEDPSLPARRDLHPYTAALFDVFELREQTRAFHRSQFPLCTFGYAVTRAAAEQLVNELAPLKIPKHSKIGDAHAYDVAIMKSCRLGMKTPSPTPENNPHPHPDPKLRHKYTSPGLRCWTLNSELFHHMPGSSMIAQVEAQKNHIVGIPPVDRAGANQVILRGETSNIGCGFWSEAFRFDVGDKQKLSYLQEEVGRKGRCLKEGREKLNPHKSDQGSGNTPEHSKEKRQGDASGAE